MPISQPGATGPVKVHALTDDWSSRMASAKTLRIVLDADRAAASSHGRGLADGFGGQAEGFQDGVMDGGAHLGDFVVLARRIDAIREHNDEELAVGVDPDGRARETGVAVAVGGEITATGAAFGGHDPAQGAGVFCEWLRDGEFRDGGSFQDAVMGIDATV